MNKYQEALDRIKTAPGFMGTNEKYRCCTQSSIPFLEDIAVLQELVDKETPRNVYALGKVDGIMQGACPNCGKPNPYSNFTVRCTCCGQRINFVRSEE